MIKLGQFIIRSKKVLKSLSQFQKFLGNIDFFSPKFQTFLKSFSVLLRDDSFEYIIRYHVFTTDASKNDFMTKFGQFC